MTTTPLRTDLKTRGDLSPARMLRSLAPLLLCLTPAAPLEAQAVSLHRSGGGAALATVGIVTLGDGAASHGILNTPDFGGDASAMLEQAFELSSNVVFLQGTFTFKNPYVSAASEIRLQGQPGAVLKSTKNSTAGVGILELTGHHIRVDGLTVVHDDVATPRTLLFFNGDHVAVESCRFRSTQAVPTSAPLRMLVFGDGRRIPVNKLVQGNHFVPSAGTVVVTARQGKGLRFADNHVGPESSDPPGFASCWRVLELDLEAKGAISGNTFDNLGNAGGNDELDALILATSNGGENHHFVFADNYVEDVDAPHLLKLLGGRFWSITGNSFGRLHGGIASGEAVIYLNDNADSPVGAAVPGVQIAREVTITGNQFHNCGALDGRTILGRHVSNVTVTGNTFTIASTVQVEFQRGTTAADNPGLLGADTRSIVVSGNVFQTTGAAGTPGPVTSMVAFDCHSALLTGNHFSNCTGAQVTFGPSAVAGVAQGNSFRKASYPQAPPTLSRAFTLAGSNSAKLGNNVLQGGFSAVSNVPAAIPGGMVDALTNAPPTGATPMQSLSTNWIVP